MIHELVKHFSTFEVLPVEPADIVQMILERGCQDSINFYPVDVDEGILRGFIHRYKRRDAVYGEPCLTTDIYFAKNMSRDWQRIVCCKELMHLFDQGAAAALDRVSADQLITEVVVPPDLRTQGAPARHDHVAIIYGLALLFPMASRELLMPLYRAGKIDIAGIAKLVVLPHRYVTYVMSDKWAELYPQIFPQA